MVNAHLPLMNAAVPGPLVAKSRRRVLSGCLQQAVRLWRKSSAEASFSEPHHLSIPNGTTEQLVRLREREALHFLAIRCATVERAFRRESLKGALAGLTSESRGPDYMGWGIP